MALSLHNHCPCRELCRVHTRLTTAPRIDASCTSTASLFALKLPVLSYILLKRKFIRQASRQCQRALDPHTDWLTRCHCLFVAWLHLKCYCDTDSTKVATIQQPRCCTKRSSTIAGSPEKALNFFFFWISHCQVCEIWRPGGNIQRCLREQVSQRWYPEVRSRSYNRDTGAVLVQRAVRIPHVEREVQRRKNKLGTGALRTFAWINCAEPRPQWFTLAPFAYKGRWRNFHVLGALSSELNFSTFFQLFGSLFLLCS